ncbi:Major facilitator superfamily MFS-1 [Mycena kentingensis (nom. inval.)]|nr:Major facilitator superfamily MFS-1 [Mycena kentingensis (nom. inval.)]
MATQDRPPVDSPLSPTRRALNRLSFERWTVPRESMNPTTPLSAHAPIPSVVPAEAFATPLPTLPMVVLSITMLGEFLSASCSTPFILFMVKGFGTLKDDAEIAFWTGILVSAFFLSQFCTAILWAKFADVYGRRLALVLSLLGTGTTVTVFGTCNSLKAAIGVRLLQGVFGGAVGVARGSVSSIADQTNEGRAYAILSFCWGLGGVTGAIVGGTFEEPALKWPQIFAGTVFELYPYLLPCGVAGSVTIFGSALGCFLSPDGGPRESRSTPAEKMSQNRVLQEEEDARTANDSPREQSIQRISHKVSGYFTSARIPGEATPLRAGPTTTPLAIGRTRTVSNSTARQNGPGFGYGSVPQHSRFALRRGSVGSSASVLRRRPINVNRDTTTPQNRDSLAHRLLAANENVVTSMAELWVQAAMNSDVGLDNDGVFQFEEDWAEDDSAATIQPNSSADAIQSITEPNAYENTETDSLLLNNSPRGLRNQRILNHSVQGSPLARPISIRRPSNIRPSAFGSPYRPSPLPLSLVNLGRPSFAQFDAGTPTSRRFSGVPNIFNNMGISTPPAMLDAAAYGQLQVEAEMPTPVAPPVDTLQPIIESRRLSLHETPTWHSYPEQVLEDDEEGETEVERPQIPFLVIVQYGLLALHATTHDQVFLSYVVSDYASGGLDLKAGDYAQLIAAMCVAQIVFQFFMYPNIGPPRGPYSHLTMFRLGSLLFIPSYLVVTLFRPLAHVGAEVKSILMLGLGVSTAMRYCGPCFAYTAVSILLNYMTPPDSIGLANGLAQSIVSLARCFGPVIGGSLWSTSTQNNPEGYALGFFVCAGVCALAILHSFTIR